MGMLGKLAVVVAVGSLLLGYHVYKPAPQMDNRSEYTFVLSTFKLVHRIGDLFHHLGLMDSRIFMQEFMKVFHKAVTKQRNPDPGIKISELTFNGVPVIMYEPIERRDMDLLPAMVYVHGGGFSIGNAHMGKNFLQKLTGELGMVCFSIEYRLAPQHPYPAALEDCEAASRYIFEHASEMGIDARRIGVSGDSAGGNMAAVLPLKFRDMGNDPQFMYQALIYPWIQVVDLHLPAFQANQKNSIEGITPHGISTFGLTYGGFDLSNRGKVLRGEHISTRNRRRISEFMSLDNIPSEYIDDDYQPYQYKKVSNVDAKMEKFFLDPYAWPLMADTLEDLPPAIVVTMGYDTLRDEGVLYLKRLKDDGVEAEHYHDEQGFHAVFDATRPPVEFEAGKRLEQRLVAYVRQRLGI